MAKTAPKKPPKLSVFTIADQSASQCRSVLRELQRQTICSHIEVILVTPDREGLEDKEFNAFATWQWINLPEIRNSGAAKLAAVHAARAPLVTYAEEHSFFDEAWAERLVATHERGYPVVGFAMENANPKNLVSWAHLYGQFGPAVAPVESGESDFLVGNHVSYRKNLLLEYGDMLEELLQDEGALFLDLRAKGIPMYIAGDAISRHINLSSLKSYITLDYLGQRSFAAIRAKAGNWPWWKRWLYAGAGPLIPAIRLRRILFHIRRTGRQTEFLPQILVPISLALLAGAWGEMVGYIFGAGDSAEEKAPIELQREKFISKRDPWLKGSRGVDR